MSSSARIRIEADGRDAEKEVSGIRKAFGSLKQDLSTGFRQGLGMGAGIGVVSAVSGAMRGAIDVMGDAVRAASDLSESQSKVGVVFGQSANDIEAWANDSATAMGQSKQAALEAAGTYGNLFQAFGVGREQSAEMSKSLVQLASDLASFNNTSVDDALLALRSGLSGETEPLKRYGIAISDARMRTELMSQGITDLGATLTPQQKSLAAYALIMKDSSLAQGDFARTSGGLANQQRILEAELENASAELGTALLPVLTALTNLATKVLIPALSGLIGGFKALAGVLDFLKPGLIAVGAAIGVALLPSLAALVPAAIAAGVALVGAFLPVLGPIAAVTAAVVGISALANVFAMDFGEMGDRLHDVADKTGKSYDEVKDRVKHNMEDLGMSFEEAAAEAERSFGYIPEAADEAGAGAIDAIRGQQREMREAAAGFAGGAEEEFKRHFAGAYHVVQENISRILKYIKEAEDPARQAGAAAADAWLDPLQTAFEIQSKEAELASKDLAADLRSEDDNIRRDAENRRITLIAEIIKLKNEQATQGDDMAQIARTKSLLTSQFMLDGLKSNDPEIRAAFRAWQNELNHRLALMEEDARSGGARAGAAVNAGLVAGMANTAWTVKNQAQQIANLIRTQFPGSEPKDPSSPLRGITKAFGFNEILARGFGYGAEGVRSAVQSSLSARPGYGTPDGPRTDDLSTRSGGSGGVHIHLTVMGDLRARDKDEVVTVLQRMAGFVQPAPGY